MYKPIDFSKYMIIDDIPDDYPDKKYLKDMENGNEDLVMEIHTNLKFGTAHYDGKYKEFSDIVHDNWKHLLLWATAGLEPESDVYKKNYRTTVNSALVEMVACSRWNKYKKAYRFDPELELSLSAVDSTGISESMLEKLPFPTFYIEFSKDGVFYPEYEGLIVDVAKFKDKYYVKIISLMPNTSDSMLYIMAFTKEHRRDEMLHVSRKNVSIMEEKPLHQDMILFVFNAILYLCASNAEVRESESTVHTYNPNKSNSNKWSSLQIFECGYSFGDAVRLSRKSLPSDGTVDDVDGMQKKKRKPTRPHPVKASWQHYWVGSGENKKRELRFKAAYYVGGTASFANISRVQRS